MPNRTKNISAPHESFLSTEIILSSFLTKKIITMQQVIIKPIKSGFISLFNIEKGWRPAFVV